MVGHICEIHLFQKINIHLHWGHTAYWICPRRWKKTNHNYFFNFVNPNTKPSGRFKTYRTADIFQVYTSKFHYIINILTWMEEAGKKKMSWRTGDAWESIPHTSGQHLRQERGKRRPSTSLHKLFNLPFNTVTVCLNIHKGKDRAVSSTSYSIFWRFLWKREHCILTAKPLLTVPLNAHCTTWGE